MKKKGTFCFTEIFERTDRESEYFYDDAWFCAPSSVLDPGLRLMSLNMNMAFFPSARRGDDYKKALMNARALLAETGFDHFQVNSDYEREPDANSLGIGAAHKYIETENGRVSLILVCSRGASYGDEWASNIILGSEGPAEGFAKCCDKTTEFLRYYLTKNEAILTDKVKYWITGYSRVGAIAGLVGAAICDNAEDYHTREDDIYVYTFESPLYADYRQARPYSCIHNTVNPFDLVPQIPPKEWGFIRYGNDDTILPAGGSALYKEKVGEMVKRLAILNPDIPYGADSFCPVFQYGGKMVPINSHKDLKGRARPEEWWFDCTLDEYLKHFLPFMAPQIVKGSDLKPVSLHERRRQFSKYNEQAFSEGARVYLGTTGEKRDAMRSTLHNSVAEDMTFRQMAWIYFLLYCNNALSRKMVKNYMGKILINRVKAQPDGETESQWLIDFGKAVEPMIKYFIKCASRDVRRNRFAYLASLVHNLDRITASHCPEVTLAWLQVLE